MQELQANTEVKVRIGPFVDVGDGFTPETGITLGAADEAELLKHNGVATVDISSNTWAAISSCDGWYDLTLTSTDTNTEGLLTVVVQDDSVCLPVYAHFMVLAQAAWVSKYTAKDTGYMDVNVKAISEDTTAADNAELAFDGTGYGFTGCTMPTVTTLTGHTAQTGDNYTRLGAPVGASISADIATVDGVADGIQSDLNNATDGLGALKTLIDANKSELDGMQGTDGKALISTDAQDLSTTLDVNAKTITNGAITANTLGADCITEAKIADNAIAAEHLNATACTKIIDDFETQSQADPTGFHVNVKEVNGTAQTANDNGADINTILADLAKVPKSDGSVSWNATAIDSIIDEVIEGTTTLRQAIRLILSFLIGECSGGGKLQPSLLEIWRIVKIGLNLQWM